MDNIILKSFKEELSKVAYTPLAQFRSGVRSGFIQRKLSGVLGSRFKLPKATKQYRGAISTGARFKYSDLTKSIPDAKMKSI